MSEIIPEGPPSPKPIQKADPLRVQPDPILWPECSDCRMAYVLKRALSFTGGSGWAWFRPQGVTNGCKHKGPAVMCWDPEAEAKRAEQAA